MSGLGWLFVIGAFALVAGQFWLLYRSRGGGRDRDEDRRDEDR